MFPFRDVTKEYLELIFLLFTNSATMWWFSVLIEDDAPGDGKDEREEDEAPNVDEPCNPRLGLEREKRKILQLNVRKEGATPVSLSRGYFSILCACIPPDSLSG